MGRQMRMGAWCLMATLAGCGSALVAEGDAALAAKDYATAARKYREARAAGEGDTDEVARKLGEANAGAAASAAAAARAHEAARRWDDAKTEWDAALQFAGNDADLRGEAAGLGLRAGAEFAARGAAARQTGDWTTTVAAYEQARAWDPETPAHAVALAAALVQRGGAAVARNDFSAALADYERAVDLDPNNADARAALDAQQALVAKVTDLLATGQAHEDRDEFEKAVAAYDAVLELWPGHAEATTRKQSLEATKKFLAAFREGVAEMAAQRWDTAIERFDEAARHKTTDLLLQKRDEAHRSKWIARADTAMASGAHDEAVGHLEQAQRYAKAGSPEWDALAARIRKTRYDKWMRLGKAYEANRDWKAAIKVYEKVKAELADATDDELNERILATESHLVRVRCELCQGTGQLTKYRFEGDQQIPTGTESCERCEGTGTDIQVKQGH